VDLNAPEQCPNGYRQEDKNPGALATMWWTQAMNG
jgi:hypothetical protein